MQEKTAKKRRTKKIITIISIVLAIILSFVGGYFSRYIFEPSEVNTTADLIRIIENFGYVIDEDGNVRELNEHDYAYALTNGLLDEYSRYYTKQEYKEIVNQKKGNRTGFGLAFSAEENALPILLKVMGNSPADVAGLKSGDLIISAQIQNQQEVFFTYTEDLSNFLTDCPNEMVTFVVERKGVQFEVDIKRASYKTSYVEYYDSQRKMSINVGETLSARENADEKLDFLGDDIALIKLSNFEGGAVEQFKFALSYMNQKGRTKLIFDLRNNGGGDMDILCEIAGNLIYNNGKKALIAYAKGKTSNKNFYSKDITKHNFITNISVLANQNTASASECLIGAMLYYNEKFSIDNLVIEENDGVARTYGKGIMQTTYLMQNGGAFKLTTALIYQPDKLTCIHKKGIVPQEINAVQSGVTAEKRAVQLLN